MFFIILLFVLLYTFLVSNTIYGGDAGDLVSAMLTGGYAHPPGYPLYTFIGQFFLQIPSGLTAAGKVSVISVLSSSFTLGILYLCLKELFKKNWSPLTALITLLTLGFNYLYWLYAIVPEVFPLNSLLSTLGVLFALYFYRTRKPRYLYGLALITGLAATHHHTYIFIFPAIATLTIRPFIETIRTNAKVLIIGIFSFLIGLLPLLYILYAESKFPFITWANASTLDGFTGLLLRQGYGTFVPGGFISNFGPERFIQLVNIFFFVLSDFSPAGLILICIGLVFFGLMRTISSEIKLFTYILLFFTGPFFFFYANFPLGGRFETATVERFYLLFYCFLTIPLYAGLYSVINYVTIRIEKIVKRPSMPLPLFIVVLFFILPIGLFWKNYESMLALKNDQTAENIGFDILKNTEENSIIILSTDPVLFNGQYVYYSRPELFPKRILVHASKMSLPFYQKTMKKHYPSLIFPKGNDKTTLDRFIQDNVSKYTIYSNDQYTLQRLPHYQWISQGIMFRLIKNDNYNNESLVRNLELFWKKSQNKDLINKITKAKDRHNFLASHKNVYALAHQNSAYFFLVNKQPEKARSHIEQAIALNPEDDDGTYLMAIYHTQNKECKMAENKLVTLLTEHYDPIYAQALITVGESCYTQTEDKQRVEMKLKELLKSNNNSLKDF